MGDYLYLSLAPGVALGAFLVGLGFSSPGGTPESETELLDELDSPDDGTFSIQKVFRRDLSVLTLQMSFNPSSMTKVLSMSPLTTLKCVISSSKGKLYLPEFG